MGAIIIGLVINMISGSTSGQNFDEDGWNSSDTEVMTSSSEEECATALRTDNQDIQATLLTRWRKVRAESDGDRKACTGCGDGRRIIGSLLRRSFTLRRRDSLASG